MRQSSEFETLSRVILCLHHHIYGIITFESNNLALSGGTGHTRRELTTSLIKTASKANAQL